MQNLITPTCIEFPVPESGASFVCFGVYPAGDVAVPVLHVLAVVPPEGVGAGASDAVAGHGVRVGQTHPGLHTACVRILMELLVS